MEGLIARLGEAIFSNAGLAGVILFVAVLYLADQLAKARADREHDRQVAREEAKERAETFTKMSDAIAALGVTIARIEGLMSRNGERR